MSKKKECLPIQATNLDVITNPNEVTEDVSVNSNIEVNFKKIDLESYAQLIENLASQADSMPFYNSGKDHAAIVMSNIFKYSKGSIKIFAGDFCGEVSGQTIYLDALKGFLEKGGSVSIILEKYVRSNNPQLFDLLHYYQFFKPEQINVRQTNVKVCYNDNKSFHFTIGDTSIYRLEEDTENFSASGSFNNPTEAKALLALFEKIQKEHSINVDIN